MQTARTIAFGVLAAAVAATSVAAIVLTAKPFVRSPTRVMPVRQDASVPVVPPVYGPPVPVYGPPAPPQPILGPPEPPSRRPLFGAATGKVPLLPGVLEPANTADGAVPEPLPHAPPVETTASAVADPAVRGIPFAARFDGASHSALTFTKRGARGIAFLWASQPVLDFQQGKAVRYELKRAMAELSPPDCFAVVGWDKGVRTLAPETLTAYPSNLKRGRVFLDEHAEPVRARPADLLERALGLTRLTHIVLIIGADIADSVQTLAEASACVREMNTSDVKLIVIAIGGRRGLDETALRTLAADGGGAYLRLSLGDLEVMVKGE